LFSRVLKVDQIDLGSPYTIDNLKNEDPEVIDILQNMETKLSELSETDESTENILREAKFEAERTVEEARNIAKKIIDDANNEIDYLKKIEEEKARKIGYEEGLIKGYEENRSIIAKSEEIKHNMENLFLETVNSMEEEIVKLVLHISEKILNFEMDNNRAYIISLIENTLKKSNDREDLTIRVSNEDYDYINDNEKLIYKEVEGIKNINILMDTTLSKGSCIVETKYGFIDNSINKQLEKIRENFYEIIKGI
jgi:flagellar assembly protein FliH